jgi:ferrochelatase
VKTGVLLMTTGSPAEPTAEAVKAYLRRFLSDPRIVDLPRWQWLPILHGIILRVRPPKSAAKYAQIWTEEGSPLVVWTGRQVRALKAELAARGHGEVEVAFACAYSAPEIPNVLHDLLDVRGCDRLVALPLYPQYASVTNGTLVQALMDALRTRVRIPSVAVADSFCDEPGYLDALAASVERSGWRWEDDGRHALVFTFHSTLVKDIEAGDVYRDQAERTAAEVAARLGVPAGGWHVGYQSVFDKRPWLGPLTHSELLPRLAEQGVTQLAVVAPGFASECLETHFDVDVEQRAAFESRAAAGSTFTYVPCLGDDPAFISALANVAERYL